MKQDDQSQALHWIEKSLSEHRDPEIVKKQKELEKLVKEKERLAYIDPKISEEEKTRGNELFKKGFYFFLKGSTFNCKSRGSRWMEHFKGILALFIP